jgi:hypothetical protein
MQVVTAVLLVDTSVSRIVIEEAYLQVDIVEGKNITGFSIVCLVHEYPHYNVKDKAQWNKESHGMISRCNDSGSTPTLEPGEFCVEREASDKPDKYVLHLGPILKGTSDGVYKCKQFRSDSRRKKFDKVVNITVLDFKGQ